MLKLIRRFLTSGVMIGGLVDPMEEGTPQGVTGLPVCLFAFGKEGLALAIIVFAVVCAGQFTIAIFLHSGSFSPVSVLKNPVIISIVISSVLLVYGISSPNWIAKSTKLIDDITIPVMLITLGVSLQRMKVFKIGRADLPSVTRVGMGFGLGILVSHLFGFKGTARGVFILQCSMPIAVFNYLLAERYGRNAKETAEFILILILLSIVPLPLILHFLKLSVIIDLI